MGASDSLISYIECDRDQVVSFGFWPITQSEESDRLMPFFYRDRLKFTECVISLSKTCDG